MISNQHMRGLKFFGASVWYCVPTILVLTIGLAIDFLLSNSLHRLGPLSTTEGLVLSLGPIGAVGACLTLHFDLNARIVARVYAHSAWMLTLRGLVFATAAGPVAGAPFGFERAALSSAISAISLVLASASLRCSRWRLVGFVLLVPANLGILQSTAGRLLRLDGGSEFGNWRSHVNQDSMVQRDSGSKFHDR
jgi:hypothetical protein